MPSDGILPECLVHYNRTQCAHNPQSTYFQQLAIASTIYPAHNYGILIRRKPPLVDSPIANLRPDQFTFATVAPSSYVHSPLHFT